MYKGPQSEVCWYERALGVFSLGEVEIAKEDHGWYSPPAEHVFSQVRLAMSFFHPKP